MVASGGRGKPRASRVVAAGAVLGLLALAARSPAVGAPQAVGTPAGGSGVVTSAPGAGSESMRGLLAGPTADDADPASPIAAPVLVPIVGGVGLTPPASATPEPDTPSGSAAPSGSAIDDDPGVGAPLDPDAVTEELRPLLSGGALGSGRTPARVIDVATGEVLYDSNDEPTTPASTMKLVTALSALDALGADTTLSTRTVILDGDAATPRVVVVGGGDPSLTSARSSIGGAGTSLPTPSMRDLAERTARALSVRGIEEVRVGYDDSLFTGPALHPSWAAGFPALGVVAPVSALVVDQGRRTPSAIARVNDPAKAAAQVFRDELERAGIEVRGSPKGVRATADSVPLAQVQSASVGMLVERMLATSDNDFAEILARLAAKATGHPASFDGVSARAAAVLSTHGIDAEDARFADGSGLSRRDELLPSTLTDLLAVTGSAFGDIASGLSVAGVNGSLHARYDTAATEPARGLVRAKTGTLTGVVGLAGYASRPDGRLLAFAVLDDRAPGGTLAARNQIDRAVATLVSCDCVAH